MLRSLALALLVASPVEPSAGAAEPALVRVGMETRSPPWCFVPGLDYSHEDFRKAPKATPTRLKRLAGFDVDVLRALAHRMGVRAEIVPVSWFDLEEGLLDRRFILSSWTPSLKTPEGIVASGPYADWGLLVAVRADNHAVRSYLDLLDGARVGHYPDPAVEKALEAMGRHAEFVALDAPEILFEELERGSLDAVIYDSFYVRWFAAHNPRVKIVGEPLNKLGYHVGVRRGDGALFEKVQAALKDLVGSEEMARIRRKWEGRPSK